MRKKFLWSVFLLVKLAGSGVSAAPPAWEEVRIVRSLEEAVPVAVRPLVLVFFSLDCPVCWDELLEMKYFIEKNGLPIDLVGIARESQDKLLPFLTKYSFFYPVVSDPLKAIHRQFKVRLAPFLVILEKGRVLYRDNTARDFFIRREEAQRFLLELASK